MNTTKPATPPDPRLRPAPFPGRPDSAEQALAGARALRRVIATHGADIDRRAEDPAAMMTLVGEAGLSSLAVPVELGGLWSGPGWTGVGPAPRAMLELAAGNGNVGQVWSQSTGVACSLFTTPAFPAPAREVVAHELLHEGRRLISSNAETGLVAPVTARRVDGCIVVSGTKTFNTGSGKGGRDIAVVGLRLLGGARDGKDGGDGGDAGTVHRALVRLD